MRQTGFVLFAVLLLTSGCSKQPAVPVQEFDTPGEVLVAMKNAYEDSWYDRLSFIQTTIQYDEEGAADTTTWFEAMELPGKLRIDIGEPESGNSWIFRNDSIYVFSQNQLVDSRPTFHPLLLLGFDAYFLEPAMLVNKLDSLGFDVSVMSDTTWQGRPVLVIGADQGDTQTQQFWIDKERLVFVRLLQKVGDGSMQQDVRFNNYERLGGGWIAPEVEFYIDGRLQLRELYHEWTESVTFDPRFFSPGSWRDADHWYER